MARVGLIALALLGVLVTLQQRVSYDVVHVKAKERARVHAEQLSPEVAQPQDEMEQGSQEQSGAAEEALLVTTWQRWQLWSFAGLPVRLLRRLQWLREREHEPDSSRRNIWTFSGLLALFCGLAFSLRNRGRQAGNGNEEEDEEDREAEESDSAEPWDLGRVWADSMEWPAPYMAEKCRVVEEMVDDLLRACQGRWCHRSVPRLQPAVGVGCVHEGWSSREDNVLYRLLVPLRPPSGHAFRLELGDAAEETPAKKSCLRVELVCTCMRERLLGDTLCSLHHRRDELGEEPSFLDTFCKDSYLAVEKTARWLQKQVEAAWKRLPQSRDCRLRVLPSRRSCKIQLSSGSSRIFAIEMLLGVQLDDSATFLSME